MPLSVLGNPGGHPIPFGYGSALRSPGGGDLPLGSGALGDTLAGVSFDQLRYFVAVAEEGNIGRAARRLCICQPPLSRQIQQLEAELGTQLFERNARGVRLRPSGVRFLPIARDILERVAAARRALDEAPPSLPGNVDA